MINSRPTVVKSLDVGNVRAKLPGEKRVRQIKKIQDFIQSEFQWTELDAVVCEHTDWHQNLAGRPDWRKAYARERQAQASIAFYETTLATFCYMFSIPFFSLGVTQWHSEFGGVRKEKIAELCAQTWPELFYYNKTMQMAYRLSDDSELQTHETDSIGIGYVAYQNLATGVWTWEGESKRSARAKKESSSAPADASSSVK